jgi:hypothetical protein
MLRTLFARLFGRRESGRVPPAHTDLPETPVARSTVGNFRETIGRLRSRAAKARSYVGRIVALMIVSVAGVATITVYENRAVQTLVFRDIVASNSLGIAATESALARKLGKLIDGQIGPQIPLTTDKFQPPSNPDYDAIDHKIREAIGQYEQLKKAEAGAVNTILVGWKSIVETVITDLGGIAFGLLFIQVALSFMRYYARLAEQYDGQADALLAADGDTQKAKELLPIFMPSSIDLGKVPVSLAEKALDTVKDVASSMRKASD